MGIFVDVQILDLDIDPHSKLYYYFQQPNVCGIDGILIQYLSATYDIAMIDLPIKSHK